MSDQARAETITGFRAEIARILVPLIEGRDAHICLIDPPNHANVGDSAILLGELAFLKAYFPRSRISFFDVDSYSERCEALIDSASIILIHGGGNFGDIWPRHQALRMRLWKRFRAKRIVQFPQSVSFGDADALAQTARAITAHRDFHLIVRDEVSYAFAKANFKCDTHLSPDMAFMLDLRAAPPTRDVFGLLRSDKEAVADHAAIAEAIREGSDTFEIGDWMDEPYTKTLRLDRKLRDLTRRRPWLTWPLMRVMLTVRRRYAQSRVDAGVDLLGRGQVVVTDRLHAHIMSCLMGIPNLFFDSLDGKVSALHRTWTHAFEQTTLMARPDLLSAAVEAFGTDPRSKGH